MGGVTITDKLTLIATVKAAQTGDNKAIETLFKEFNQQVFYSVLLTVKNEETAKDITQETFITVIKKINELENPEAFPGWVKKVAHSKCSDYYKKKEVIHETPASPDGENDFDIFGNIEDDDGDFIPDNALDKDDLKRIILDILNSLPDEQRAAIFMRYYEEMSVKEIAEIQGVSEGTVMSRLNYGRKAIAKAIEEYEKENDIKLHAIPIIPFFGWLFKDGSEGIKPNIFGNMATEITKATGIALSTSSAASSGAAVADGVVATTGVAAKIASIPLVVKIAVPVVLAATIATPAVLKTAKKEPPTTTVPTTVVETTEIFDESTTIIETVSESSPESTPEFIAETVGVVEVVTNVSTNQIPGTTLEETTIIQESEPTTKKETVPTTRKPVVETTRKVIATTEEEGYDEDIYEIYDGTEEYIEEIPEDEVEEAPEIEMDGTTSPR